MTACPNCGNAALDGTEFCERCGADIAGSSRTTTTTPFASPVNIIAMAFVGLCASVPLTVALFFLSLSLTPAEPGKNFPPTNAGSWLYWVFLIVDFMLIIGLFAIPRWRRLNPLLRAVLMGVLSGTLGLLAICKFAILR